MTEIVKIGGKSFLIKDGTAYEIKEASVEKELPATEKIKKKLIKPNELEKTLQDLSVKKTVELFGKVNSENPYKVDTKNFWKQYKFPPNTKYSISKRIIRENILDKQMKSAKLNKDKRKQILNKCKEINYKSIKEREKAGNKWAVEWLAKENTAISQVIHEM